MTSGNFLETKSDCGVEYTSFVALMILAIAFAAFFPHIIAFSVVIMKSVKEDKRRSAYQILEEILAKADLEERNEAFLDACVEYSKKKMARRSRDLTVNMVLES
jgi:membrane-bound ClpP family serine protease